MSENRKRKIENSSGSEDEEKKSKRPLLEEQKSLLDLADEILMEIALKLDGESKINLTK
jgi:hypothetical protein